MAATSSTQGTSQDSGSETDPLKQPDPLGLQAKPLSPRPLPVAGTPQAPSPLAPSAGMPAMPALPSTPMPALPVGGQGTVTPPAIGPGDAPPPTPDPAIAGAATLPSAPVNPLANPDASQLAGGVSEYGHMWKPGQAPPPGLDAAGLDAWQHNNPTNVGYAPSIWSALQNGSPIQNADGSVAAGITPVAPTTLPLNTSGYRAVEGGQTYTDPTAALKAMTASAPTAPAARPGISPTGGATDINGTVPSSGVGTIGGPLGASGSGSDVGGGNTTGSTGNPTLDALIGATAKHGVTTTPTDPNNPLTNQTLSVGPTADPVQQAIAAWNTFKQASDPSYQASIRDAIRGAAAGGSLGSGKLNTDIGDIANTRANALDTARQSLLENALGTQNENAYRDVGISQQQQGFQNQQQQEAFNNSLQQLLIGSQGDPSQLLLALSQLYGSQGAAGANAAAQYGANSTANNASQQQLQQILQMIQEMSQSQTLNNINNRGVPGVETMPGGGY